jgi:hypothetical protein
VEDGDGHVGVPVDHWDRLDRSQRWWVRAELRGQGDAATRAAALAAQLAERYPQDRDQPFARVLVLQIVGVIGWAAAAG